MEASRFLEPRLFRVSAPSADLRRRPDAAAPLETQIPFGFEVHLYEDRGGWCWVQSLSDSYVGYMRRDSLEEGAAEVSHRVSARAAFLYREPDAKAEARGLLGMGSRVFVFDEEGGFGAVLVGGAGGAGGETAWIPKAQLLSASECLSDAAMVAERLMGVPYLWGGRDSCWGLDCSALIQMAFELCGVFAPRDSDLQEVGLGGSCSLDLGGCRRGDLVFWEAHVGIMLDGERLLHANAHHMCVGEELLLDAARRIMGVAGPIRAIRRV